MSSIAQEVSEMVDMLPIEDQAFVCELIKKLVRAWDPDFTKLTEKEAAQLSEAEEDFKNGIYYTIDDIDNI